MAVPLAAADGDPLGNGLAAFDLGGNNADSAAAVLVQPDGKVIVVGTVTTGAGTWSPALARFLPGGALDGSFGSFGRVVDPLGIGNQTATAAHLLSNGRILVAGTLESGPPGNSDFYVLRLLENGSVDAAFGIFGFKVMMFDVGGMDLRAEAASARFNAGSALRQLGRFEEALVEERQALDLERELHGEASLEYADVANGLVLTLHGLTR